MIEMHDLCACECKANPHLGIWITERKKKRYVPDCLVVGKADSECM